MGDEKLRVLAARARDGGPVEQAAWLAERMRVGELDRERVRLAAYVGHAGARALLGNDAPASPDDFSEWIAGLLPFARALEDRVNLVAHVALACAHREGASSRVWTELSESLERALAVHPPDLRALDADALDLEDQDIGALALVGLVLQDASAVDLVEIAVHSASDVGYEQLGLFGGRTHSDQLRAGSPLVRAAVASRLVAWALAGPDDAGAWARAPQVATPQAKPLTMNWDAIGGTEPLRKGERFGEGAWSDRSDRSGAATGTRLVVALAVALIVATAVLLRG